MRERERETARLNYVATLPLKRSSKSKYLICIGPIHFIPIMLIRPREISTYGS